MVCSRLFRKDAPLRSLALAEDPAVQANNFTIGKWAEEVWRQTFQREGSQKPLLPRNLLEKVAVQAKHCNDTSPEWKSVRGPAGAVCCTLRRLKWEMLTPTIFKDAGGEEIDMDERAPLGS